MFKMRLEVGGEESPRAILMVLGLTIEIRQRYGGALLLYPLKPTNNESARRDY